MVGELTLLTQGQVCGNYRENQLDVLKKYGTKSAISDLAILTGGAVSHEETVHYGDSFKERTGCFYTRSRYDKENILIVERFGNFVKENVYRRWNSIRPVLSLPFYEFDQIIKNRVEGYNETEEIEYGEYPQYVPEEELQVTLENKCQNNYLKTTGRNYTFDSTKINDFSQGFQAVTYVEYEYNGKKYIRIKANCCTISGICRVSNREYYSNEDYVWVEVSPVKWLIDEESKLLISKIGLLAGIRFNDEEYDCAFEETEIKKYLDNHMFKDLFQSTTLTKVENIPSKEKQQYEEEPKTKLKRTNPYRLKFNKVSEEEIIKGAIESGVAVFLHGRSSEGKSARVKQIDPECEIIYLRNASPESLNGKSVYNGKTGEMIDIKPTWLKKIEEKCEKEPNKYHIVFFDEITNALPSIQGIAFNIVLDREVNGKWKLPENARIVAAGNDMEDSLAANELAEPLFNRFAHVYIKTTVESWLKWANKNNIHPAIYAYIAFKREEALRSKYDGKKPNADPRKWEMASKMLYKTGNPEMLRALVGKEITKEFCQFCKQRVITLEDVLNDNYTENDLKINTSEKYATAIGLSSVDEENFIKVREFVKKLGKEICTIFESIWSSSNEKRMELIAEAKLMDNENILKLTK